MILLNYEAAADYLAIKKCTLYSLVSRKKIPHIRLNSRHVKFDQEELEKWLDSHRVSVGVNHTGDENETELDS